MTEPKWTPGPWLAAMIGSDSGWFVESINPQERYHYRVCHCGTQPCSEADARLISAAPEMYEALKTVQPYFERMYYPDHPHCKKLKAALAKAEGDG
jgi:hypothetical protein